MTSTTSSERSPTTAASLWRRVAAYFVDYFVFIDPLLRALGLCGWILWTFGITGDCHEHRTLNVSSKCDEHPTTFVCCDTAGEKNSVNR